MKIKSKGDSVSCKKCGWYGYMRDCVIQYNYFGNLEKQTKIFQCPNCGKNIIVF